MDGGIARRFAQVGIFVSACLTSYLSLGAATPAGAEPPHLWFTPTLVAGDSKLCGPVLASARQNFRSDIRSIGPSEDGDRRVRAVPHPFSEASDSIDANLGVEVDQSELRRQILTDRSGAKLYVFYRRIPGCGGACEGETLVASDTPINMDAIDSVGPGDPTAFETPSAESWSIFQTAEGDHIALAQVGGHLQVYKLTSPKILKLSCDVALEPGDMRKSADASVRTAIAAIDELNLAVHGLSRDAGSCGSLQTPFRWQSDINHALDQVLYRPWALNSASTSNPSENTYGDWPRIAESLKLWSLTGPVEAAAWKSFEATLPRTIDLIAHFYVQAFGWEYGKSRALAEHALKTALSRGFGFYMYSPLGSPEETVLRRALLDHRPMSEIQALPIPSVATPKEAESALTLAIDYPEALKYLLSKGFDPDSANGFGKTPLMYAAQMNQIESARILLEAGADPNARTFIPEDTCNFTLKTDGMTALHYAVRYASAALINLFIDRGADTYSSAHSEMFSGDYPLDWLHRYSGSAVGVDRNTHLTAADLEVLIPRLRVAGASERIAIAREQVIKAEAEYRSGAARSAYNELRSALDADDSNAKAIDDLPLIALKAGEPDVAMESADKAIATLKGVRERASAWFNKGLACRYLSEHRKAFQSSTGMCGKDFMQMFVIAYDLDPTPERANALRQVFRGEGVCNVNSDTMHDEIREYSGLWDQAWSLSKYTSNRATWRHQGIRVYVLRPAGQFIGEIHWVKPSLRGYPPNEPAFVAPQPIVSYTLGSDELTIIEADITGVEIRDDLLLVDNQRCNF
jgi:tetratricopeptide (TPR) repeat protein